MAKVWMWALAAACVAASVAASPEGAGRAECTGVDDSALLQHSRAVRNQGEGKKAITFQGGGFSSVTSDTAVLSAVMALVGKDEKLAASDLTLAKTKVLEKFDIISSNSGGSWFSASLLYSQRFQDLLTQMAGNPDKAGQIFNDGYMKAWFAKAQNSSGGLSDAGSVMSHLGGDGLGDSLYWGDYIEEQGSWSGFVKALLTTTSKGDITGDTTLGSALPWAKGKTWFACASLVTPTPDGVYKTAALFRGGVLNQDKLHYTMHTDRAPKSMPYVPVRWQVPFEGSTMDGGLIETAGLGTDGRTASLEWTNERVFGDTAATSADAQEFGVLVSGIQDLPLYQIVGSSSAAAGGNIVTGVAGDTAADMYSELGPNLAVWAAPRAASKPFHTVEQLMEPFNKGTFDDPTTAALETVANLGVLALVDGVYTDNTAIGHAVVAGATEVVSVCQWTSLKLLFTDGDSESNVVGRTEGTIPFAGFPIFATTMAAAELAFQKTFHNSTAGKHFALSIGELDVVTRKNPFFGIDAGIPVKLRLILGGSSLGVGADVNMNDFANALQGAVTDIHQWAKVGGAGVDMLKKFFT